MARELLDKTVRKDYVENIMRKQYTMNMQNTGDTRRLSSRMLSIEINLSIAAISAVVKAVAGGRAL